MPYHPQILSGVLVPWRARGPGADRDGLSNTQISGRRQIPGAVQSAASFLFDELGRTLARRAPVSAREHGFGG